MKNLPVKDALKQASSEEATPAHLHELAQHPDHSVKMRVASHANTAEHTLQHIYDNAHTSGDNAERIKNTVINNNNAPAHLINDKIKNYNSKKDGGLYKRRPRFHHHVKKVELARVGSGLRIQSIPVVPRYIGWPHC